MKNKYKSVITVKRSVSISMDEENKSLMAWVDDEMQDGIDYSEFEKLLEKGVPFEDVCKKLTRKLKKYNSL